MTRVTRSGRAPILLALLGLLSICACAGRSEDGLSVTFNVQELPPPPPPEPAPAYVPPPPPPPSPPPEDPRALLLKRLSEINGRLRPVYFAADSFEVSADSAATVQANAAVLGGLGPFRASVEGHTDGKGSEGYNHWLGLWRAKAVKDKLRDLALDPSRFTLRTRGADVPVAPPGEDGDQPLNRRVEIIVTSLD